MTIEEAKKPSSAPQDKSKKGKPNQEEELSEEDKALRDDLEMIVQRIHDPTGTAAAAAAAAAASGSEAVVVGESEWAGVQRLALNSLKTSIRTATSSMTSVPKPLKFLRPHYDRIKTTFAEKCAPENKTLFADILSMMATTMATVESRECLHFKLQGSQEDIGEWGHEYIRHLTLEISNEWEQRLSSEEGAAGHANTQDLEQLVDRIILFDMLHNSEPEACDLLMEVGLLEKLIPLCDERNYSRVCQYLLTTANYVPEPEDSQMLTVAFNINKRMGDWTQALLMAMRLNNRELIQDCFTSCDDPLIKKQMALMLARQRVILDTGDDETNELLGNQRLNSYFLHLAKDLDSLEPKTPEDIYKSHLESASAAAQSATAAGIAIDSARKNLASTFVNAFVNAGYGSDKLMTDESTNWIYKNKDHGMLSAAASLGLLLLWDIEGGLAKIDKYLYSPDNNVKAGALMAVGIINSGVRTDIDPALALLQEHLEGTNRDCRLGAIIGIGIAYAGSAREDLCEYLVPILVDGDQDIEVVSFVALSLGLIFCGTCNEDISPAILQVLMERSEKHLSHTLARFLCLALGLLFLGKGDAVEPIIETSKILHPVIAKYCELTVETCAYAGTGNVLKVQKLLQVCGDHLDEEKTKKEEAAAGTSTSAASTAPTTPTSAGAAGTSASLPGAATTTDAAARDKTATSAPSLQHHNKHQSVAVVGISLIAMAEEVGLDMAMRSFDHFLQYGDPVIKRAVPLAISLLSVSNPKIQVMDTLSKLSHDIDADVSQAAILALGLVGAGTNNARIGQMLRQLASFYQKDVNHLFVVRIAQGLLFMGKGLMTLSPYHSGRNLMSPVAVAGLLILTHAGLDMRELLLGKYHFMLYYLACSMYPRMMVTVDEKLNPINVQVRVGQAVDTVAQAGRPKSITGFQTHNTPVLLQYGERAELATEEYIPLTSVLEGVVILKKNPDFTEA